MDTEMTATTFEDALKLVNDLPDGTMVQIEFVDPESEDEDDGWN